MILSNKKWVFDIKLKEVNHEKENIVPNVELDNYVNEIYA